MFDYSEFSWNNNNLFLNFPFSWRASTTYREFLGKSYVSRAANFVFATGKPPPRKRDAIGAVCGCNLGKAFGYRNFKMTNN